MKNRIDTIFKERLEDTNADEGMMEKDWQAMKTMIIPLPAVNGRSGGGAIAGKLFIAVGVVVCVTAITYFLWPAAKENTKSQNVAVVKQDKPTSNSAAKPVAADSIKIVPHKIIHVSQKPIIIKQQPLPVTNVNPDSSLLNTPVVVQPSIPVVVKNSKDIIDSFYNLLKSPTQLFTIDNTRDTIIIGNDSSEIIIPANCFTAGDGKAVTGMVTVMLDECYSYSDIVARKLFTVSDDKLLQSGGMLQIQAMAMDKKLQLAKGKQLSVAMPTKKIDNQMQLFLPAACKNCDTSAARAINWRPFTGALYNFGDRAAPSVIGRRRRFFNLHFLFGWLFSNRLRGAVYGPGYDEKILPTVLNLQNDPFRVIDKDDKTIAKFRVTKTCKLGKDELIAELKKRYSYYDEIKIIYTRQKHTMSASPLFARAGYATVIGDSISVTPQAADRLKLWAPGQREKYYADYAKKMQADSVYRALTYVLQHKYNFNISSLGWMNCDHFYNDPRPKVRYVIDLNDTAVNYSSQLILLNGRLNVPAKIEGNFVVFNGLPVGEPVQLVSIGVKNNKVVANVQKLTVSKEVVNNIVFEEISADEMKKTLQRSDMR